jgi:hypothetical protein
MFHLRFGNMTRILGCVSALLVVQAFGQNNTDLSLPRVVEKDGR